MNTEEISRTMINMKKKRVGQTQQIDQQEM